jgi:hypothetical protein
MSKNKKSKVLDTKAKAEERKIGKTHLYLLLSMVVLGAVLGIYFINQQY